MQALMNFFVVTQCLPIKRVGDIFKTLYGFRPGGGTIELALLDVQKGSHAVRAAYKTQLQAAPVLCADETGVRVAGKLHWVHVKTDDQRSLYELTTGRSEAAIRQGGVLDGFTGVLVHDRWKPYFGLACQHALSNAHLLRELTYVHEKLKIGWAKTAKELLLAYKKAAEVFHHWKPPPENATPEAQLEAQIQYRNNESQLGFLAECYYRFWKSIALPAHDKARSVWRAFTERAGQVLAFVNNPRVPFDNNTAERALRMLKVKLKTSGCFRTQAGAICFLDLRALVHSAMLQKQDQLTPFLIALKH
jgi:transposase